MVAPNHHKSEDSDGKKLSPEEKAEEAASTYTKLAAEKAFMFLQAIRCDCNSCTVATGVFSVSCILYQAAARAVRGQPEMLKDFVDFMHKIGDKYPDLTGGK